MKNVKERNDLARRVQSQPSLWDMQARRQQQQVFDVQNQRQQILNDSMRQRAQNR